MRLSSQNHVLHFPENLKYGVGGLEGGGGVNPGFDYLMGSFLCQCTNSYFRK